VRHKPDVQADRVDTQQPAKSDISCISVIRAARVAGGTSPTVRDTVGMSA